MVRAFIEGIEVPVIAANIQTVPDSPSICSLQIPPLAEGLKILPRSLVHVFFDDGSYTPDTSTQLSADGSAVLGLAVSPTELQQTNAVDAGYRSVFCGEVCGFAWQKDAAQRSLILQCMDLSNYWDTAYQWVNTDLFGPGYKAMFSGGGTNLFTDFMSSSSEVMVQTIQQGMRSGTWQYPKLKGLVGGIVHILERIGGAYFTDGGKNFRGSNTFFSIAELRLHITQMIGAYDKDPTAMLLLGGGWEGFFGRTIGNLGDQVSIRNVITALMPVIFHETYAQPCPYYTPGSSGSVSGYRSTYYADDPNMEDYVAAAQEFVQAIADIQSSFSEGTLLWKTTTQLVSGKLSSLATKCTQQASTLQGSELAPGRAKFASAASALGVAASVARSAARMTGSTMNRLISSMASASGSLSSIPALSTTSGDKKQILPARMWSQIFRPDVWFTAPPRCNVFFPDEVTHFAYNRQFFQEPTRLLLKTNDEFFGEDMLFDKLYFAPYATGLKTKKKSLVNILQGDIMMHELYTGILPVFEKMGEYNIFAAKTGAVNGTGAKVGMAQRTTNFLFFKHRFEQRQASLSTKFKPYVACGFPGLVLASYLDAAKLQQQQDLIKQYGSVPSDYSLFFGSHMLGNVEQVTHNLDQSGGSTQITLTHCREADEKVEFLGAIDGTQRTKWVKGSDSTTRSTDVAAVSPPSPGSMGPAYGEIVAVQDVTEQYMSGDSGGDNYKTLPAFTTRPVGQGARSNNVPDVIIGYAQPVSAYDPRVAPMFDSVNQIVMFRAYRVSERVSRYTSQTVDMPIEELIRPGWYGDCWHPGKIGDVYNEFFGIGAITDPSAVSAPVGPGGSYPQNTDEVQQVLTLPDKSTTDPKTGKTVNNIAIRDAIDFLSALYSYVKKNELSVADFIRSYTWRPIMSMQQLFGDANLQYQVDGRAMRPLNGAREGFHSRAFGDYEDIFLLVPPEVDSVLGIKRNDTSNLFAMKGDTRRAKRIAVQEYLAALLYSSAVLG